MLMDFGARFLAHDMRQVPPTILDLPAPILAVGLELRTSIREVYRDVPVLGEAFARARSEAPVPHRRDPWAVVAASKGHDAESGAFTYFLGEVVTEIGPLPEGRLALVIPVGTYAVFPIRPRHKAGWPVAIAAAKRHVYLHWLPHRTICPPVRSTTLSIMTSAACGGAAPRSICTFPSGRSRRDRSPQACTLGMFGRPEDKGLGLSGPRSAGCVWPLSKVRSWPNG